MSIPNVPAVPEPRPAPDEEYGPITASEPLPVPLPVGITRSQLTADPPPVRTKPSMIDGIAPEVALFAPAAQRKAAREALPKAPGVAPPQPVKVYSASTVVGVTTSPSAIASDTTASVDDTPRRDSVAEAASLLNNVLRFQPGEQVALCRESSTESFYGRRCTPAEALAELPTLMEGGYTIYIGINPTLARVGRGGDDDVARQTALFCDMDVKEGSFKSESHASAAIEELSELIGVPPAAVVDTGGGLHPYWPMDDGTIGSEADRDRCAAALAGWGRLAAKVARRHGAEQIDDVYQLSRVLRLPGSLNMKYDPPRTAYLASHTAEITPVSLTHLEVVLEQHGCLMEPPRRTRTYGADGDSRTPTQVAIDEIPFDEVLDHRFSPTNLFDSCGCPIWRWWRSQHEKSITTHEGCENGFGVHFWSETARQDLGLPAHTDRLNLAAALLELIPAEKVAWARERGVPFEGTPRGLTDEDLAAFADEFEADAASGVTTINMPGPGGTNLRVEVGREGLLARATRCRAAAEAMRRGDRATTAVQLPDGLPAVHPMLGTYRQRAVNELGSSQFDIDWTIPAADLIPNDLRPLREAVHGPRATDKPLVLPAEEATCAQAIAKAVGGRKLARDVKRSGTRDFLLSWAGSRWVEDGDAGEVCVQALMHTHLLDTDPAVRQQKIVVFGTRKPDAEEEAEQRQAAMEAAQARGLVFDPTKWRPHPVPFEDRAWASSDSRTRAIARRVTRQLEVAVPDTNMFDADPFVVGTPGGYLLLEDTVTVTAPDPARLVTKLMGAAYDPGWPRGRWLKFMSEFQPDPEVRAFLQRLAGAALVGRQDEHILPNLSGEGGNGKGVFLEILKYAFGDYGVMMQTKVLTVAGSRGHATDLMPLKGARLAVFNEVPGVQLDAEQLKIINGGGTFSARGIAENTVEFPLSHMSWMSTNNLLEVAPGNRRAIRRRLRQIPCRADFSGLAGSGTVINGLAEKIWEAEGPGIVAWIVEGYLEYRRRCGLDVPAAIDAATDEALAATSTWSAFCAEAFQVTRRKEDVIDVSPIFTTWRHYRGETSDQAHSRPGNERAVPKLLAQELHGIWTEPSHGRQRARAVGLVWTDGGKELLKEATSGPIPFIQTHPPSHGNVETK